jgi:tetratricopeptide (TPR) repeat protein
MARHVLTSLLVTVLVAPAFGAETRDPECSIARMEEAPSAVIAPCSALLARSDLPVPERAAALHIRGRGYHNTNRFELAAADYTAALWLTPDNDEIWVSFANIAFREKLRPLGRWMLSHILELNPRNAQALRMIGADLHDQGDNTQAIAYYSRALEVDPAEPYALLFRSWAYADATHQYALALKDADALVAIDPASINRQGFLDRFGERKDFHVVALQNRAEVYAAIGKPDLAEADLNAAVAYSGSAHAFVARGEFLSGQRGREQAALADLDRAIALEPENTRAWHFRGTVLTSLQRFPEAFAAFDQVVTIDPTDGYALRMRARMRRALGHGREAVDDIERAMAADPTIVAPTMLALRRAGYWRTAETPHAFTTELHDALTACMLDPTCN